MRISGYREMPRTLLHIAEYSPHTPGAFVHCLEHLAPAARAAGWSPVLGLPTSIQPRAWHARLRDSGWEIVLLRRPWGFAPRFLGDLARLLQSTRPAVVHLHFHAATLVPVSLLPAGRRASRILHWHNPPHGAAWRLRAFDGVCRSQHLAVSAAIAESIRRAIPRAAGRVREFPNAVSIPASTRPVEGRDLLTVAAFRPQKDPDTLLAALRELVESGWKGRLHWVGSGSEADRVRQRARDLGLGEVIDFLGDVQDPGPLYEQAALCALSTHYEGQPYAVLEAMARGRAVVATDLACIRELLGEESQHLCVPPGDPSALAAALRLFLESPALAQEVGERLRRRAQERHSVEGWIARLLELYERFSITGARADVTR